MRMGNKNTDDNNEVINITDNAEVKLADAIFKNGKGSSKGNNPVKGFLKKIGRKPKIIAGLVVIVLILIPTAGSVYKAAYEGAKEENRAAVSQQIGEKAYKDGEANNHVKNDATAVIEDIKSVSKLEVLRVGDIEYVKSDNEDNGEGITTIFKVPGTGVYAVDLNQSEIVVDAERDYIYIKVPKPQITEFKVNYSEVEMMCFKNNAFDDSVKVGEDIAQSLINEAYVLMQKEFDSNARYYDNAEKSAKRLIENIVKGLNNNVENLQVDVEFAE